MKDKTVARITLCKSDSSLSNMESSALDDEHKEKVKNRKTGIALFFQTSKSSTNTEFGETTNS